MKKNQQGFSLIELLIVVVIIGIIAAVAVPNLIAARRAANEGSAVSLMRTLQGANSTYQSSVGNGKYAFNLKALNTAGLIDSEVANSISAGNTRSGYYYNYDNFDVNDNPSNYNIIGRPESAGSITASGTREFFVDGSGVIRVAPSGVSLTSPPFDK